MAVKRVYKEHLYRRSKVEGHEGEYANKLKLPSWLSRLSAQLAGTATGAKLSGRPAPAKGQPGPAKPARPSVKKTTTVKVSTTPTKASTSKPTGTSKRAPLRGKYQEVANRRPYANAAAELAELLAKRADDKTIAEHIRSWSAAGHPDMQEAARGGKGDQITADLRAVASHFAHGRRAEGIAAMDAIMKRKRLAPVGGAAGSVAGFDPDVHEPVGASPERGASVRVIRPGISFRRTHGEVVHLSEAQVTTAPKKSPAKPARPGGDATVTQLKPAGRPRSEPSGRASADKKASPAKAPAKKTAGKAAPKKAPESPSDVVARLDKVGSRDEAREILQGRGKVELREILTAAGFSGPRRGSRATVADLVDDVVAGTTGSRLDHEAIQQMGRSSLGRAASPAPAKAAKKVAPRKLTARQAQALSAARKELANRLAEKYDDEGALSQDIWESRGDPSHLRRKAVGYEANASEHETQAREAQAAGEPVRSAARSARAAELRRQAGVLRAAADESDRLAEAAKAPAKAAPRKATPTTPNLDRQIAEAEARVTTTRKRLETAQAAFDAASRDPKADALGEHFPLGTGGAGGGRQGSSDAQLRRYVEARKARDAAQSQNVRAEARLRELTARQGAAGKYSRDTVSAGDAVKVNGRWERVQKANDKTVQIDAGPGMDVRYRWDQVTDHRSAATPAKGAPDKSAGATEGEFPPAPTSGLVRSGQRQRLIAGLDQMLAEAPPELRETFGGRASGYQNLVDMRDRLVAGEPERWEGISLVLNSIHHRYGSGRSTNMFTGEHDPTSPFLLAWPLDRIAAGSPRPAHPALRVDGSANPSTVRQDLLALATNDERREYLAGLGLNPTKAKALAKDLGARQSREGADANLDSIVSHFDLPRGASTFSPDTSGMNRLPPTITSVGATPETERIAQGLRDGTITPAQAAAMLGGSGDAARLRQADPARPDDRRQRASAMADRLAAEAEETRYDDPEDRRWVRLSEVARHLRESNGNPQHLRTEARRLDAGPNDDAHNRQLAADLRRAADELSDQGRDESSGWEPFRDDELDHYRDTIPDMPSPARAQMRAALTDIRDRRYGDALDRVEDLFDRLDITPEALSRWMEPEKRDQYAYLQELYERLQPKASEQRDRQQDNRRYEARPWRSGWAVFEVSNRHPDGADLNEVMTEAEARTKAADLNAIMEPARPRPARFDPRETAATLASAPDPDTLRGILDRLDADQLRAVASQLGATPLLRPESNAGEDALRRYIGRRIAATRVPPTPKAQPVDPAARNRGLLADLHHDHGRVVTSKEFDGLGSHVTVHNDGSIVISADGSGGRPEAFDVIDVDNTSKAERLGARLRSAADDARMYDPEEERDGAVISDHRGLSLRNDDTLWFTGRDGDELQSVTQADANPIADALERFESDLDFEPEDDGDVDEEIEIRPGLRVQRFTDGRLEIEDDEQGSLEIDDPWGMIEALRAQAEIPPIGSMAPDGTHLVEWSEEDGYIVGWDTEGHVHFARREEDGTWDKWSLDNEWGDSSAEKLGEALEDAANTVGYDMDDPIETWSGDDYNYTLRRNDDIAIEDGSGYDVLTLPEGAAQGLVPILDRFANAALPDDGSEETVVARERVSPWHLNAELYGDGRVSLTDQNDDEIAELYSPEDMRDGLQYLLDRMRRDDPPDRPRYSAQPTSAAATPAPATPPPAQVRPALARARTLPEVNAAIAAELRRLTGRDTHVDMAGSDLQVAREHGEGILQAVEHAPQTRITSVTTFGPGGARPARAHEGDEEYANARGAREGRPSTEIAFSTRWVANPDAYRRSLEQDAAVNDEGVRGAVAGDPVGVAIHEFGHLAAMQAEQRHFRETRDRDGQLIERFRVGIEFEAADRVHDEVERLTGTRWGTRGRDGTNARRLKEREVSLYASWTDIELAAEAFADVVVHGDDASDLSHDIYAMVTRGPRPASRRKQFDQSRRDLPRMMVQRQRTEPVTRAVRGTGGLPPRRGRFRMEPVRANLDDLVRSHGEVVNEQGIDGRDGEHLVSAHDRRRVVFSRPEDDMHQRRRVLLDMSYDEAHSLADQIDEMVGAADDRADDDESDADAYDSDTSTSSLPDGTYVRYLPGAHGEDRGIEVMPKGSDEDRDAIVFDRDHAEELAQALRDMADEADVANDEREEREAEEREAAENWWQEVDVIPADLAADNHISMSGPDEFVIEDLTETGAAHAWIPAGDLPSLTRMIRDFAGKGAGLPEFEYEVDEDGDDIEPDVVDERRINENLALELLEDGDLRIRTHEPGTGEWTTVVWLAHANDLADELDALHAQWRAAPKPSTTPQARPVRGSSQPVRIDLEPGEELVDSHKVGGEYGVVRMAATRRGGRPSVRLGIGTSQFGGRDDEAGPWRGRNADHLVAENERRRLLLQERRDLENGEGDWTPAERARFDELDDMDLEEVYASGFTARLDSQSIDRLRAELEQAVAKAEAVKANDDARWAEVERLEAAANDPALHARRDPLVKKYNAAHELVTGEPIPGATPLTPEEDAELDRLTDEWFSASDRAEALRAEGEDPEFSNALFESSQTEGVIPGEWSDVHYEVYYDDGEVHITLSARPHGATEAPTDENGEDVEANLEPAEVRRLLDRLGRATAGSYQSRPVRAAGSSRATRPKAPRSAKATARPAKTTPPIRMPNLATASDRQLLDAFRRISNQPPGTPGVDQALQAIYAELDRREGTHSIASTDTPKSREVDRLVASGWGYLDAYAKVHDLDITQLQREQRMQLVDAERRPGERREQTIRRMYHEMVAMAYLQAEDDTRGNLLNRAGRAAGIDPATLWSGPSARARKYASDELKQWWSEHGGRITVAEYMAQFTGDQATAQRARAAGQGRDYGI